MLFCSATCYCSDRQFEVIVSGSKWFFCRNRREERPAPSSTGEWSPNVGVTSRMQYFRENLCLVSVCLSLCGCAASENRSGLSSPTFFDRVSRQTAGIDVAESKVRIWDHLPWAGVKNRGSKKVVALVPATSDSTCPPRALNNRGEKPMKTEQISRQAVQHVAWQTRADHADSATISDRQDQIPVSRLPTSTVWR